jgi:hypothetical protein
MSNVQHGTQPEGVDPEVVHGDQPLTEDQPAVVVHGDQPLDLPTSDDVGDDEPASGDATGEQADDELPPAETPTSPDVTPVEEPDGEEG